MRYSPFIGKFPKVQYKADNTVYGDKETLTNIFFRVDLVRRTIENASAYYLYLINEGDTPEILADKIYGDPGAFWLILYANDIFDPQFDWPLSEGDFAKYMAEKYRRDARNSSLKKVKIINAGTGYSSGIAKVYDGYGDGASVSITVDEYDGSVLYANVTSAGFNYYMDDIVTVDITHLKLVEGEGIDAVFQVEMNPPDDIDVLYYVKETTHHYEKVVTRVDSRDIENVDQNRYIVSKDQLSNGVIYLQQANGVFEPGDFVFVSANIAAGGNTRGVDFSGFVVDWNPLEYNPDDDTSNGWITLSTTKGKFVEHVELKSNTGNANGLIMHTSFNDINYMLPNDLKSPFEYYYNLPETQAYESFNIEDYTLTEIYKRFAISIWDHEYEMNEKKKLIKIIKPQYLDTINRELDNLIANYKAEGAMPIYSFKRRLF